MAVAFQINAFQINAFQAEAVTEKFSSDTGSGAESYGDRSIVQAEVGGGVEASSLLATLTLEEAGSGAESYGDRSIVQAEVGSGVDAKANYPSATLEKTEAGSGAESYGDRDIVLSDTGSGVESYEDRAIVQAEAGSGVDTYAVKGHILADSGSGVDASQLIYDKFSSDAGSAVETYAPITVKEYLYPSAAGDTTQLSQYPSTGSNYDKVDDLVGFPDDASTYVYPSSGSQMDAYNLVDFSISEEVVINWIRVHWRAKGSNPNQPDAIRTVLRTDGGAFYGGYHTLNEGAYVEGYTEYSVNPETSAAWTKSDLDGLQAGIQITTWGGSRTTQVYVEVDAILTSLKISSDTGSGTDVVASKGFITGDSGSALDALFGREYSLEDIGSGVEISALLATRLDTDSGIGAEISKLIYDKFGTETGTGLEAIAGRHISLFETGSGVEAAILEAILTALDEGSGVDEITASWLERFSSDTGLGVDASIALLAAIEAVESGLGTELVPNLATNRRLLVQAITSQYRKVQPLTSLLRRVEAKTSHYRQIQPKTTLYRDAQVKTTQKRKVKVVTTGG